MCQVIQPSVHAGGDRLARAAGRPVGTLYRTLIVLAALFAGRGAASAAPYDAASDPLRGLLATDDYDAARSDLLRQLRGSSQPPCARLAVFSDDRNQRVREHAVRAMDDDGCADFSAYRSFAGDQSPWVMRAVLGAVERHRMVQAVPFLIDRLTDARMILSDEGSFTLGSLAHRALRAVSCQSFHFDPEGSVQGQADAVTRWRSWYAAHRGETRDAWVTGGIALARDYIARDYAPHRREGIDLLALIGPPALPALREVLSRRPLDLRATLSCNPEAPPRVTDEVPCVLTVVNSSPHRLLLAPGDPDVHLTRADRDRGAADGRAATPERSSAVDRAGDADRPSGAARSVPSEIAARIVDLSPGEILRRDFKVGPVGGAGRYEVRAILPDLGASLQTLEPRPASAGKVPGASSTQQTGSVPTIEASTILRFEQ